MVGGSANLPLAYSSSSSSRFHLPRPLAKRYAGYRNYIYPCMYMCDVPLPEDELRASSRPIVA